MDYSGFMQEQTKAQIRSTRGETIDLALPSSCTIGELRSFLIDEYNYDPNTRLLYNGGITGDGTRVCDYPYGSLMIATPADMQPQRQPLPPRQQPQQQPPPQQQQQQQQQHLYQQRPTEEVRTSPRPASGNSRKGKPAEAPAGPAAARRPGQTDGGSPEAGKKARSGGSSTIVKHPPKKSPRLPRSTSAESNHSDGAAPPLSAPAPVDASPAPPAAAARERPSPNHPHSGNSGRKPASRVGSARNPPSARASAPPQDSADAAPSPAPTQAPPPPPQQDTAAETSITDENDVAHRQRMRFTVECNIPSLKRVVYAPMNGESSVVDLVLAVVAEAPEIGGQAQVIFRGKVLPQTQRAKLFDMGMRADTRVFIAAGEFSNPETITLLEIERDTDEIDKAMRAGGLTDLQRKGYYEELMRILFRTDGLMSLEGEWRQRRKDAVKRITTLQDALGL